MKSDQEDRLREAYQKNKELETDFDNAAVSLGGMMEENKKLKGQCNELVEAVTPLIAGGTSYAQVQKAISSIPDILNKIEEEKIDDNNSKSNMS